MEHLEVPSEAVKDLEGLTLLASGLERVTGGGPVHVRSVVIVETENLPAFWMLQDVLCPADRPEGPFPASADPLKPARQMLRRMEEENVPGVLKVKNVGLGDLVTVHRGQPKKVTKEPKSRRKPGSQSLFTILSGKRHGETLTGKALGNEMRNRTIDAGVELNHPVRGKLFIVSGPAGYYLEKVPA